MGEKIVTLCANVDFLDNKENGVNSLRNIILGQEEKNNIYTAIAVAGNRILNGDLFLADDIEINGKILHGLKSTAHTLDGKPHNINHSKKIEDVVGTHLNGSSYFDEQLNGVVTKIKINPKAPKYNAWYAYYDTMKAAGQKPNISVEVRVFEDKFKLGELPENIQKELANVYGLTDKEAEINVVYDYEFIGSATVLRGACNPNNGGCGFLNEVIVMEGVKEYGVVPSNPPQYGKDEQRAWRKLRLSDFTDKQWNELSNAEKSKIARCFAWAEKMPPDSFGQLKLGHHFANGTLSLRGCIACIVVLNGGRGGVNIPTEDKIKAYKHIASHLKNDFGRQPPEFKGDNTEEISEYISSLLNEYGICENELFEEEVNMESKEFAIIEENEEMDIEAILSERDALIEEIEDLHGKLAEYEAKERATIVAEIKHFNKDFEDDGNATICELRKILDIYKEAYENIKKNIGAGDVKNDGRASIKPMENNEESPRGQAKGLSKTDVEMAKYLQSIV